MSGGCARDSSGIGTNISNIYYKNVYTCKSSLEENPQISQIEGVSISRAVYVPSSPLICFLTLPNRNANVKVTQGKAIKCT